MRKETELLHDYLTTIYSNEYVEKIMMGIKNPAKFTWITKELTYIYQVIQNKAKELKDIEFLRILEIIEDELANVLLICQDSKCDPLNFIDYKKK
ncbi:MAG: hypothetical protein ACFFKA_11585 [Candidatus Thorarchaeota archaeon]